MPRVLYTVHKIKYEVRGRDGSIARGEAEYYITIEAKH